jgi:hypothetical protein
VDDDLCLSHPPMLSLINETKLFFYCNALPPIIASLFVPLLASCSCTHYLAQPQPLVHIARLLFSPRGVP